MVKIRITQVRSTIRRPQDQKDTMRALGLARIRQSVEHTATPALLGMVKKVSHLVKVEEV